MRRRALFVLVVLVGLSLPVQAVPILDIKGLEHLDNLGTRSLSVIGSSGSGNFGDEIPQATMGSFIEGPPGDVASCGSEPGNVLECLDSLNLAFPRTATADSSTESDDQHPPISQSNPDQFEGAQVARQSSVANPIAIILLTGGLAAAGFAGWKTLLKGRRFLKGRRRGAGRRRRSGSTRFS
jgi:hypothetical protein